jgi:hypothetical protein
MTRRNDERLCFCNVEVRKRGIYAYYTLEESGEGNQKGGSGGF